MTLGSFLERHGLTQQQAAKESGVPLATLSEVVRGTRSPRQNTINSIIRFVRRYEPKRTPGQLYELLFFREAA